MNDFLSDALTEHEPLSDPLEEMNLRLAVAAADIAELRAEVLRLDRDLDESRRLNLRAAELLDLVYVHLAGNQGLPGSPDTIDFPGTLNLPATLNAPAASDRAGTSNGASNGAKEPVLEGEGAGL
jgi:hypothetical protein